VEYVLDNVAGEPVLCVVSVRGDEGSQRAAGVVRALVGRGSARLVDLRRLTDEQIRAMARACLDGDLPESVGPTLTARAEGLPFLLEELLAAAVDARALTRSDGRWQLDMAATTLVPRSRADTVRRRMVAYGPRNVPHTFKVESAVARWLSFATPAGFERFFFETGEPALSLTIPPPPTTPPDFDHIASVVERYAARFV
jgi:hypothetical protein